MAEQLMGVDYFPVETDMKDDDKVFALKYRFGLDADGVYDNSAAFAAYGRFVELLAAIYHDGFALKLSDQKCLQLSQRLGLALPEFKAYVQTCVDVGLFDVGLWTSDGVLTSRGIQNRYFHAVKRRKGDIPEELKAYMLTSAKPETDAQCGHDVSDEGDANGSNENIVSTPCEHDADTMNAEQAHKKEYKRKEKNTKEEDKKPRTQRTSSPSSSMSLLSGLLDEAAQDLVPLQCFHAAPTDGRVFNDSEDVAHPTPWDALCARYSTATGGQDVGDFARALAAQCPSNCRCGSSQVSQCYALICSALDKYDASKCASPLPLAVTVLKDRVICDE